MQLRKQSTTRDPAYLNVSQVGQHTNAIFRVDDVFICSQVLSVLYKMKPHPYFITISEEKNIEESMAQFHGVAPAQRGMHVISQDCFLFSGFS